MRVALITCDFSFDNIYEEITNGFFYYENLGIEYIAAELRKHGYNVDIYNETFKSISRNRLVKFLKNKNYQMAGFYTNSSNVYESLDLARSLPSNIHKCFGGYAATLFPEQLLKHECVDSVIVGEGEAPFLELVQCLERNEDYHNILNLYSRLKTNPLRSPAELSKLPHPVRDELRTIVRNNMNPNDVRLALVLTSRGCLYKCTFCVEKEIYKVEGRKGVHFRQPANVVDEIEELVKGDLKINNIWIIDDDFVNRNEERAAAIAEGLIRKNVRVNLEIDCRADNISHGLFSLLKEAGLVRVFVGVESFSQNVLNRYKKCISVGRNTRGLEVLKDLGISFILGIIFFDEETSLDELYETLKHCREYGFDCINDPVRVYKSYSFISKYKYHIPKDRRVRHIYEEITSESNMQFRRLLERKDFSKKSRDMAKVCIGEKFWNLVVTEWRK